MRLDAVRTVVYPKGTGGMDMNLCMKQKVFSWGDRFTVWDENGNDRYYVRGEVFSLGKKLHLTDTTGAEVAFIQQKAFSFRPRFYVYMNGALQAEIVKDFTFFTQRYRVEGMDWEVNGNFGAHDYEISGARGTVADVPALEALCTRPPSRISSSWCATRRTCSSRVRTW